MLDRNCGPTRTWGILVGVELEDGVLTAEQASLRLSDALSWCEGVGEVHIEVLGEVGVYEDTKTDMPEPQGNV